MLRRTLALVIPLAVLSLLLGREVWVRHRTAAIGGFGSGPDVVLVHGLGSSAEQWLPMARNLARDHHVVFTELPGHGLADMTAPLTLAAAADALDHAIEEQCDGPVVLVGHSVGGLVAAAEALREPRRVRALVLVETALRPQSTAEESAELLRSLDRDYRGTLHQAYVSFGRNPAQGEALFGEAARQDPAVMKEWIRLALTADLSRDIGRLQVPMLVVLSARSWADSESWHTCGEALGYEEAAGVQPVRLENTGHFVMLDRPGLLAGLVRRFARERGIGASSAVARPAR